jgi:hypothetical protein
MILVEAGGLAVSGGTALAQDFAHRYRKPLLVAELGEAARVEHAMLWLRVQKARHGDGLMLAIGGPRESEAPGIYGHAMAFIRALI